MKIAVDTRNLRNNHLQEDAYFLFEILKRIIKKHPEHEFIFIFDKPYDAKLLLDKNITVIVTGPRVSNVLLCKFWYDIRLPALLRF